MRLSMLNDFSKLKFLVIAETRFDSIVMMLKSLRAIKEYLTHRRTTKWVKQIFSKKRI